MPVPLPECREGPDHIAKIQSRIDIDVVGDVGLVIEYEEIVMRDSPVQRQNCENENGAKKRWLRSHKTGEGIGWRRDICSGLAYLVVESGFHWLKTRSWAWAQNA